MHSWRFLRGDFLELSQSVEGSTTVSPVDASVGAYPTTELSPIVAR